MNALPQVYCEVRDGHGVACSKVGRRFGVNSSTVFRWAHDGVKSSTGKRVKLEHVRIGSRLVTSELAVERFIMALSDDQTQDVSPIRSPAERRKAHEAANRKLIEMGA